MSEELILHCPSDECKGHDTPKLYVNVEMGVFNCFRCGFKGKLKALYRYPKLVAKLEEQLSMADFAKLKSFKPLDIKNVDILKDLSPVREIYFEDSQYDYLLCRGWTEDLINLYRPLVSSNPLYKNRVILPVIVNDKIIYYTARSLDPQSAQKYKNPDGVSRKNVLFKSLVQEGVLYPGDAVILEGYFDAYKVPNAVALLGKTISPENEGNLLDFLSSKTDIYVSLDEGAEAWIDTICKTIVSWFPNKHVHKIKTSSYHGNDLGKLSETMTSIMLLQWIKQNSELYQPNTLSNSLKSRLSNTR